jgi:hypothetical protein
VRSVALFALDVPPSWACVSAGACQHELPWSRSPLCNEAVHGSTANIVPRISFVSIDTTARASAVCLEQAEQMHWASCWAYLHLKQPDTSTLCCLRYCMILAPSDGQNTNFSPHVGLTGVSLLSGCSKCAVHNQRFGVAGF